MGWTCRHRHTTSDPIPHIRLVPGRGFWIDPGNDWIRFVPFRGGAAFRRHYRTAWEKGFVAGYSRHAPSACPYLRIKNDYGKRVTFGYAFRRAWIKGHKAGSRRRQRRHLAIWPLPT